MTKEKKNQNNDREEWKLNKKFIFVHEVLREFLDCVDEMNNGNYSRQPTNSIIPSTEKILDYFQSYTQKKVEESLKNILEENHCDLDGTYDYDGIAKSVINLHKKL